LPIFARRDLFGIKRETNEEGEEVYVTNADELSGAGITDSVAQQIVSGFSTTMEPIYDFLKYLNENFLRGFESITGEIVSVLQVGVMTYGQDAQLQLYQIMSAAMQPLQTMEDLLYQLVLTLSVSSALQGFAGVGPESAMATGSMVAGMAMMSRQRNPNESEKDQAVASTVTWSAGGAVVGGAIGSLFGPAGTAAGAEIGAQIGAVIGAEMGTDIGKYYADLDADLDEDMKMAAQDAYDFYFDPFSEGGLAWSLDPNNWSESLGDPAQKLSDMGSSLDSWLSDTLFNDFDTGFRTTMDDLQYEFEQMYTKLYTAIVEILTSPLDFLTNFGQQLADLVALSLAEMPPNITQFITDTIKFLFSFPHKLVDALTDGYEKNAEGIAQVGDASLNSVYNSLVGIINAFMSLFQISIEGQDTGLVDIKGTALQPLWFGWDYLIPIQFNGFSTGTPPQIPKLSPGLDEVASGGSGDSARQGGYLSNNGLFGIGGLAVGPSHENGGIPGIVDGYYPIEFEGGEFIINKKTVDLLGASFFHVLNGIHSKNEASDLFNLGVPSSSDMGYGVGGFIKKFFFGGLAEGVLPTGNLVDETFAVYNLAGDILKNLIGVNGFSLKLSPFEKSSLGFGKYELGDLVSVNSGGASGKKKFFGYGPKKISQSAAEDLGLLQWRREGGEVEKFIFGDIVNAGKKLLSQFMPTVEAAVGYDMGSLSPYGKVDWWWRDGGMLPSYSPISSGISYATGGFAPSMSGSGFSSSIVLNTGITNDLLRTLISVTESKDMSVTVVDEGGNEQTGSNIKISKEREMSYRGARMLA